MMRAGKCEEAKNLYEAQIISIRSRTTSIEFSRERNLLSSRDIKLLALTHGRLGKE